MAPLLASSGSNFDVRPRKTSPPARLRASHGPMRNGSRPNRARRSGLTSPFAPGPVDDTAEKTTKNLLTTTRETPRIVHNASRIVHSNTVDDHTPPNLASSTA